MNGMHDLMKAVSSEPTLVAKFIESLQQENVEVKYPPNRPIAKWFVGQKKNEVLILAHKSTRIGWWGVKKQIIDRIINYERIKNDEILWGMALIDGDCRRGFWIPGKNFPELITLRIVTLGRTEQYNFNKSALEQRRDLALEFMTVRRFIQLSGLE